MNAQARAKSLRARPLAEDSYIYGRWYRKKMGIVEPELPKLVGLLKRKRRPRALDVGCGIGRHVSYLAGEGIDTYGFDISRKAIAQAERLLKRAGLRAHLSVGDMFQPFPFESGFFDAVIGTRSIHHGYASQVKRTISETNRVTRKGGYVFVQVPRWSRGKKVLNPGVVRAEPTTLVWSRGEEAGVPHHHFTKDRLLHLFGDFEILELHSKTEHYGGWCLLAQKRA
jgi:SAM-dependent methyltransferase